MSAHHLHQGIPPRRSRHAAAWAAAAFAVLAVSACSSPASSVPASTAAAASIGPGGHKPTLTGSGSTFDAPFFPPLSPATSSSTGA